METLQLDFHARHLLIDNVIVRFYIDKKGEPWFEAKAIAQALGYSNQKKAVQLRVDDSFKASLRLIVGENYAGHPHRVLVCEAGLWALLCGSIKRRARMIQRWIYSDVMPTIRRTGRFVAVE